MIFCSYAAGRRAKRAWVGGGPSGQFSGQCERGILAEWGRALSRKHPGSVDLAAEAVAQHTLSQLASRCGDAGGIALPLAHTTHPADWPDGGGD
jgi:hypothetical protein